MCTAHLRSGDVQDDLLGAMRLCYKCHRLHPVAEFEVRLRASLDPLYLVVLSQVLRVV